MSKFFGWIADLFMLNDKEDTYIGLSQLRTVKQPVDVIKPTVKQTKDIKISDLMRGIS